MTCTKDGNNSGCDFISFPLEGYNMGESIQKYFYTKILAFILHVCVVPITMHADKCIPVFFTRYLDLSSLCVHLLCVLAVKSSGSGV